jgi:hypothetical protein
MQPAPETEETTRIITVIHGFHANNAERTIVLLGEYVHVQEGQVLKTVPFELLLLDENNQATGIERIKNPGPDIFEKDFARSHG